MSAPAAAPAPSTEPWIAIVTGSDKLVLDGLPERAIELLRDGGKTLTLPESLGGVQITTRELFNAIVRIAYSEESERNFQITQEEFQWRTSYRVALPAFRVSSYMLEDAVESTPEKAVSRWVNKLVDILYAHEEKGDLSCEFFSVGNNPIEFVPSTKTFQRV